MKTDDTCSQCAYKPNGIYRSCGEYAICSRCIDHSNFIQATNNLCQKEKLVNFPIKRTSNEEILGRISAEVAAGTVEGIAAVVKNKDGSFEINWSKNLNYLELLGMFEQAKFDLLSQANDII